MVNVVAPTFAVNGVPITDAATIQTGVLDPARLGTGTRDATTALHGDGVFRVPGITPAKFWGPNNAIVEFGAEDATKVPGVLGTTGDYYYDTDPLRYQYFSSKGANVFRIPILRARMQQTPFGALSAPDVAGLHGMLDAVAAVGAKAGVDNHDYFHYRHHADGQPLTTADAAMIEDFWTRMALEFGGHPALMWWEWNEPANLVAETTFSGTTRYTWDTTTEGWIAESADNSVAIVDGKLRATVALAVGNNYIGFNDGAAGSRPTGPTGGVLQATVTVPAGGPTVKARCEYRNASGLQQAGFVTTTCLPGTTTVVTTDHGTISSPTQFRLQIDVENVATAATITVDFDDFAQGTLAGKNEAEVAFALQQAMVNGIRKHDTKNYIGMSGYPWQTAKDHRVLNENIAQQITDPANKRFLCVHAYGDSDASGTQTGSFDSQGVTVNTLVERLTPVRDWARQWGIKVLVTEIAVKGDEQNWLTMLDNAYDFIEQNPEFLGATAWAAGPLWGTYMFSLEPTRDANQVVTGDAPQMAVIANRPTTVEMATKAAFDAHTANTANPHNTTSNQIGSKVYVNGTPGTAIGTTETQIGSVTITPRSVTSRIVIMARLECLKDTGTTSRRVTTRVRRGTANTDPQIGVDSVIDSQPVASTLFGPAVILAVDTPAVTTTVTYSLRALIGATAATVSRFEIVAME